MSNAIDVGGTPPGARAPRIAYVGRRKLGGVQMRGVAMAKAVGVEFVEEKDLNPDDPWDILVLVKYWENAERIRRSARSLFFDPLDCWSSSKAWYNKDPIDFWKWCHSSLRFDVIIGTSPSCLGTMHQALHGKCVVRFLPHHCDPRIDGWWHDPNGPVVYAGGQRYLGSYMGVVASACHKIGSCLTVAVDSNDVWRSLKGARLVLHPRLPPHDTRLNRMCKPQIKFENAMAAGIPILGTDCPCYLSMADSLACIPASQIGDVDAWAEAMKAAIDMGLPSGVPRYPGQRQPITIEEAARYMKQVFRDWLKKCGMYLP